MKNAQLSPGIRTILFLCGVILISVLYKPIWKIELSAPQYPEGLIMKINADGLDGDVEIINGLNHYIGMKTLHSENFIEFKILPYVILLFIIFFITVAILGKRRLMKVLFISFILFGILAMVDFSKWEYDYGHNLDPNAAIIVPGMSYQPPLIGFKQLLNFGAYSVPDIGGWLFVIVGLLLLTCIILDYSVNRKSVKSNKKITVSLGCIIVILLSGCTVEAEPIKIGSDNCHYCKMTISDNKFGAEVITMKGKIFKYDEMHCLLSEISEKEVDKTNIREIYYTDFCNPHGLIKDQNGFYLKSDKVKGPMGGNVASFSSHDSLVSYQKNLDGEEIKPAQLISGN